VKSKSALSVSVWLVLFWVVFTGPAFGATLADLAGTWNLNAFVTGPDAPWWQRMTMTINANGTFTGSYTAESSGTNKKFTGAFKITSTGFLLTVTGIKESYLCQMDLGNTVMACTGTWGDGSTDLAVGMKQADSYSMTSDFPGDWEANMLDGGPSDPSWMRISNGTIDSSGNFQGTYSDSNNGTGNPSEQLALSSSGEVTLASCTTGPCLDSNFDGYMDASKSVMVGTYGVSQMTSDAVLAVFTKMAPSGSYSMDDLVGTWEGNILASGPGAPWWDRGTFTVKSDGRTTISTVQSDGKKKTQTGITWSISDDGVVTVSGSSDQDMNVVMNSAKTVMVETSTWSSGSPGTTEIGIIVKTAGLPGAPTGVSAAPGNAQAAVSFTPPAANGSTITTYTVTSSPDSAHPSGVTAKGTKIPITVKPLINGQPYTFTVTATNGVGTGPASNPPSNQVTPGTKPDAPTIGVITVGVGQATVNFTEKSDGGSPTTYAVTSNPAGGVDTNTGTNSLSHIVTNLTSGKKYSFTVTATNAYGKSSSTSKSVTIE
jgi:hypothetical protein